MHQKTKQTSHWIIERSATRRRSSNYYCFVVCFVVASKLSNHSKSLLTFNRGRKKTRKFLSRQPPERTSVIVVFSNLSISDEGGVGSAATRRLISPVVLSVDVGHREGEILFDEEVDGFDNRSIERRRSLALTLLSSSNNTSVVDADVDVFVLEKSFFEVSESEPEGAGFEFSDCFSRRIVDFFIPLTTNNCNRAIRRDEVGSPAGDRSISEKKIVVFIFIIVDIFTRGRQGERGFCRFQPLVELVADGAWKFNLGVERSTTVEFGNLTVGPLHGVEVVARDDAEHTRAEEEAGDIFLEIGDEDFRAVGVGLRKFRESLGGDGDLVVLVVEVNTDEVVFVSSSDITTLPGDIAGLSNETDAIEVELNIFTITSSAEAIDPDGGASSSGGELDSFTINNSSRLDGGHLTSDRFNDELHQFSGSAEAHRKASEFVPVLLSIAEAKHAAEFLGDDDLEEGDLAITSTSSFTANIIDEETRSTELRHLRLILGDIFEVVVDAVSPKDGTEALLLVGVEFDDVEHGVLTNGVADIFGRHRSGDTISSELSSVLRKIAALLLGDVVQTSLLLGGDFIREMTESISEGVLPESFEAAKMSVGHEGLEAFEIDDHVLDVVGVKTDCSVLFIIGRRRRVRLAGESVLGAVLDVIVEVQPASVFKSSRRRRRSSI